MSKIFPPPEVEETKSSNIELPVDAWDQLDTICKWRTEVHRRMNPQPKKVNVSRSDALKDIVRWAYDQLQIDEREFATFVKQQKK